MTTPVFPTGIRTVTLTGRYLYADGRPFEGFIELTMPTLVTLASSTTIAGGTIRIDLDVQGRFSTVLIATDNAGTLPAQWSYRVRERLTGLPIRAYSIVLPQATAVVDISAATQVSP